jgi:hypothetical protein
LIALLALGASIDEACGQTQADTSIALGFEVDGQPVTCKARRVRLSIGEEEITPTLTPDGFLVPSQILKAYASKSSRYKSNVSAQITCDARTVALSGLYPVQVLPGQWKVGIAYPTTWFDSPSGAPEHGVWVSYIDTGCNDCDPDVVVWRAHSEIPATKLTQLKAEQSDSPERARDVSYALAVFHSDYRFNRDRLANLLAQCLDRPRNSPEDDVCNGRLVQYLANLYWRGDDELLDTLINAAQSREDVVDEAGSFYGDLLDRRFAIALNALSKVPREQQQNFCAMALKDGLSLNPPKLARIQVALRKAGTQTAQTCLRELR